MHIILHKTVQVNIKIKISRSSICKHMLEFWGKVLKIVETLHDSGTMQ